MDSNDVAAIIERPLPPPKEVAAGSEATRKPPGPTEAEINEVYRAVKDYIGNAVLDELNYRANKVIKDFGKDVQTSVITTAAIDTGVSIVLFCVPVVGVIVSAIYAVIMAVVRGLTGPGLQRTAQAIIFDAQRQAMLLEAMVNAKMKKDQADIIRQETPAAIRLALSLALGDNVPVEAASVEGLGNVALALQMFAAAKQRKFQRQLATMTPQEQSAAKAAQRKKMATAAALYVGSSPTVQRRINSSFKKTVESLQEATGQKEKEEKKSTWEKVKESAKAESAFQLATGGILPPGTMVTATLHPDARVRALASKTASKVIAWQKGGIEYISGHIVVTKAKEAAKLLLEKTRLKLMAEAALNKAKMKEPEFRANLRLAIAKKILTEPTIKKMLIATLQARQNLGQSLKQPEQVGLQKTKPNTGLILGGSAAAALAAYLFLK